MSVHQQVSKENSVKGGWWLASFVRQHPVLFGSCAIVLCVFLLLFVYIARLSDLEPTNPLPSDEEMIANFKANRADFEEIVRRYREFPGILYPSEGKFWYEYDDTLELFRRAGIDDVDFHALQVWLPDPYSVQSALEVSRIIKNRDERFPGFTLWQKYGALWLSPATTPLIEHPRRTDHRKHWRSTLRYGRIWKTYYFFPEDPYIENSTLLWAAQKTYNGNPKGRFYEKEGVTIYHVTRRVLQSLNHYPENWDSRECVYRKMESHWFLAMCRGR